PQLLRLDLLRQALGLGLLLGPKAGRAQQIVRPGKVDTVHQHQQQDQQPHHGRPAAGPGRACRGRTLTSELVICCMPAWVCTSSAPVSVTPCALPVMMPPCASATLTSRSRSTSRALKRAWNGAKPRASKACTACTSGAATRASACGASTPGSSSCSPPAGTARPTACGTVM